MDKIQIIKDLFADFKSSELLLICILCNVLNITMFYNLKLIKKNKLLLFLGVSFFIFTILFTIYIIFLGVQYAKQ